MIDTETIRHKIPLGGVKLKDVLALCDEIDRLRAGKQQPAGKTVRAEAYYAVDRDGYYKIVGMCGDSETQDYCQREAANDAAFDDGPVAFGKLTADLPVGRRQSGLFSNVTRRR